MGKRKEKVRCKAVYCSNFAKCKGFCGRCYRRDKMKDPAEKEAVRLRQKENGKRYNRTALLKSYGLTEESYQQLFDSQNGLCDVCKKPSLKGVLHIDHCHETDKVRGLLCSSCNTALGNLQHSIRIIDSSINYLRSRP